MDLMEIIRIDQPLIVIGGPTASGKSGLALALARQGLAQNIPTRIINADSMQIYREIPMITAQPSQAEQSEAEHALYAIQSCQIAGSVQSWQDLARAEVADCYEKGVLPILIGGTGLYLRSFLQGMAQIDDIPADIRQSCRDLAQSDKTALYQKLTDLDPGMAAKLRPQDPQRVCRALEVVMATGKSLADWQAEAHATVPSYQSVFVTLMPERAQLYAQCDQRLVQMLEQDVMSEIAAFDALGLDPALPASKAVGLRELQSFLRGDSSKAAALAAAQQATRRYAKRQMTWFRHQIKSDLIIDEKLNYKNIEEYVIKIFNLLLTRNK